MVTLECRPVRGEVVPQDQACPRPVIHAATQDRTQPRSQPFSFVIRKLLIILTFECAIPK